MDHHKIIAQEVEHALKAVATVTENIDTLVYQRSRLTAFIEAMEAASTYIPKQLDLFEPDSPDGTPTDESSAVPD